MIVSMAKFILFAGVLSALGLASTPTYASVAGPAGTVPGGVAPAVVNWHGCPTDYFCFYQDVSFGGGMRQFHDCGIQNMSTFTFNNQTSSWINHTNDSVDVFAGDDGVNKIWHEDPLRLVSWVGTANNDRASSFRRNC